MERRYTPKCGNVFWLRVSKQNLMILSKSSLFKKAQTSLQYRVIGLVSLVMPSATIFGVVVFTYLVYQTEQDAWQNRQREAARSASRTVEVFMNQVQEYMNPIGLVDPHHLELAPEPMPSLPSQNQAPSEIIRLDSKGQVFAAAHQPDETPVPSNLFTIPQSSWFLQAQAGQPHVGEAQISATNEPYIIPALPAPDNGVVAARPRMDVPWDIVSEIQFGETGRAHVVNEHGDIVAHPDFEVIPARTNIIDQSEMAAVPEKPDRQWNGVHENLEDLVVVGPTQPIKIGDRIIFTEISQTEVFSTTRQALIVLGGGIPFMGIIVMAGTSHLPNRTILWPVAELRDGAEHIGEGDLDHRLDSGRPDEIGQAATAFNQMAANLKDREAALAQARDEAPAANRIKSQILANVSHDLRTPLNAIMGYTEMLQKGIYGAFSDKQQSVIQRILTNTRNLTGMVNKLVEQARLETGTLKLDTAPFAPADLIEGVQSTMGESAREKGVELITTIDVNVPLHLSGDFNWLYQILANLVENALKFTEQGAINVHIYCPDETHWAMQVADTGSGIPLEAQVYIFEPFRQVDGTATRKHKGAGLGLSIVKQVTNQMGGQVRLESEVDCGSTFTILLPLTPTQETNL